MPGHRWNLGGVSMEVGARLLYARRVHDTAPACQEPRSPQRTCLLQYHGGGAFDLAPPPPPPPPYLQQGGACRALA